MVYVRKCDACGCCYNSIRGNITIQSTYNIKGMYPKIMFNWDCCSIHCLKALFKDASTKNKDGGIQINIPAEYIQQFYVEFAR